MRQVLNPDHHNGRVKRGISFGLSGLTAHADGTSVSDYHRALRNIVEFSVIAENYGLDAVWSCEHHFSESGYLPTPLVALAAIAERTEEVTIGTDVMLPSMWDPVRFAEESNVVDQLSAGRLILGVGIGYRESEFEGLGLHRKDRVERLSRCIEVLKQSATGQVSGVGNLGEDVVLDFSPLPFQPGGPPVWIGGQVEPAVRRARRLSDGFLAPMMSPAALRRKIEWLNDEEPIDDDFALAQTSFVFVAAKNAIDIAAPGLGRMQRESRGWQKEAGKADVIPEWRPGEPWESADPSRFALPEEERLTNAVVVGSPDECIARLTPFVEELSKAPGRGMRHFAAKLIFPVISDEDNAESIRLYGKEVLPALREVAARVEATR